MKIPSWLANTLGWTVLPGLPTEGDITVGPGEKLERHTEWSSAMSEAQATAAITAALTEIGGTIVDGPGTVAARLGSTTRTKLVGVGSGNRNFPVTVSVDVAPSPSGSTLIARVTSTPSRGDLISVQDARSDVLDARVSYIAAALQTATAIHDQQGG